MGLLRQKELNYKRLRQPRSGPGFAALIALSLSCAPGFADAYMDQGIGYYKKHDFNRALASFAQAYRANPANANAVYYQGLCKQYMRDNKGAAALYASAIANFPGTPAANGAMAALSRLDPEYYNQLVRPSGGSTRSQASAGSASTRVQTYAAHSGYTPATDLSSLPDFCRVQFHRDPSNVGGNMLVIEASINGRRQDMLFDTGAEMVAIGKNQLADLGIPAPSGPPTGQSMGVGSSGGIPTWRMRVDLKVGTIERKGFPLTVQESMSMAPLLGQSFFRDFQYTIDYSSTGKDHGTITFVKRGAASASQDSYSVPFKREGNNMVVNVDIGGRTVPMFFDTGAAGITFTMAQCKQFGIQIPEDATPMQAGGVGGTTNGVAFTVRRIRLGPIDKSDVPITAIEAAAMPHPLLGQTYFGDWQYTIDNQNNVIHFVRR